MLEPSHAWPKRVFVVGVDFSEFGDAALDEACELAKMRAGAELHVLHVVSVRASTTFEDGPLVTEPDLDSVAPTLERHVQDRLLGRLGSAAIPKPKIVTHLRVGDPAREIARLALDLDADAMLVGTHGRRGLARMMLGSVAERVLRYATCPVIVVSPKRHGLEAAKGSDLGPPCEACAAERAASRGAERSCEAHRGHELTILPASFEGEPSLEVAETQRIAEARTPAERW